MSKTNKKLKKLKNQTILKPIRDINSKNQKKKKAKQLRRQINKQLNKMVKHFNTL